MGKAFIAKSIISIFLCGLSLVPVSFAFNKGHFQFHGGIFNATQGKAQDIMINGMAGEHFTVFDRHDTSGLLGIGYLFEGLHNEKVDVLYGLEAFYLFSTSVQGTILQEQLFSNLAYSYKTSHLPIYAKVQAKIPTSSPNFKIYLLGGLGVNFMQTHDYHDWSNDGGITNAENAFSGKNVTNFSATAGFDIAFYQASSGQAVSCGYRFFYLGNGDFTKRSSQFLNTLTTGPITSNAFICTLST